MIKTTRIDSSQRYLRLALETQGHFLVHMSGTSPEEQVSQYIEPGLQVEQKEIGHYLEEHWPPSSLKLDLHLRQLPELSQQRQLATLHLLAWHVLFTKLYPILQLIQTVELQQIQQSVIVVQLLNMHQVWSEEGLYPSLQRVHRNYWPRKSQTTLQLIIGVSIH